eukprot:TRINITY_DN3369_c0_g1_i1.p1 TRINITY_DN3369_c0_g1~~TRINITY_DN3369_c0_g1_i1.p1  ORF type:complete len:404 (+),score=67.89 TRINITY_DN3369_c0_g1_i1:81-1292(+)
MAKAKRSIPPSCKRYGPPLYCASWVSLNKIEQNQKQKQHQHSNGEEEEEEDGEEVPFDRSPSTMTTTTRYLVLGGGGGEGRSGVPNALLLTKFDFASASLSEEPVYRLGTNGDVPYRMDVHPCGEGVICAFPKGCRWFEWKFPESMETHKLVLESSGRMLTQLEDVGLQLALTFDTEGSLLAAGGEDGHLRVFKWPNMEVILDQTEAHPTIKDLDFSKDGKFLVSLGSSGPCRVWDLTSFTVVANLPRENGEVFRFCRFSHNSDNNQILYVVAMQGEKGSIVSWDTISWKRLGSKQVVREPISAFNVSTDGKLLAFGSIEGDVSIINSTNMRVQTTVRKAHLGVVTALVFSQDSRALVSASFDASARVTIIEDKKQKGSSMPIIIFIILLAILVYFVRKKGAL